MMGVHDILFMKYSILDVNTFNFNTTEYEYMFLYSPRKLVCAGGNQSPAGLNQTDPDASQ